MTCQGIQAAQLRTTARSGPLPASPSAISEGEAEQQHPSSGQGVARAQPQPQPAAWAVRRKEALAGRNSLSRMTSGLKPMEPPASRAVPSHPI